MTVWSLTPLGFEAELDVLALRLETLDAVVDRHVIVEADRYYSGQPKPWHLDLADERWAPWRDRMQVVRVRAREGTEVRQGPPTDAAACDSDRWRRENEQRDALSVHVADSDIVLLSDLDEIPRPGTVRQAALILSATRPHERLMLRPRLAMHSLTLTWRWPHAVEGICRLMTGATMSHYGGAQSARLERGVVYGDPSEPAELGWHLAYMGGVEAVQCKLANAAHHELDREPFNTREWIEDCMATGRDLFDRPDRWCEPAPHGEVPPAAHDEVYRALWGRA